MKIFGEKRIPITLVNPSKKKKLKLTIRFFYSVKINGGKKLTYLFSVSDVKLLLLVMYTF